MQSAGELEQLILENLRTRKWPPGHRVPPERVFSADSGLSRSTVRRVLARLKKHGLITQTVGSGTYVSERVGDALATLSSMESPMPSPAELLAARLAFEPAILGLVVANANSADMHRMERCCDAAEAAQTLMDFEHWDGALHEAIASAAHNTMVTRMFALLHEARLADEWGVLKQRSVTPGRRQEFQHEHRLLVAALRRRDLPAAQEICAQHLLHVRRNMLGF